MNEWNILRDQRMNTSIDNMFNFNKTFKYNVARDIDRHCIYTIDPY